MEEEKTKQTPIIKDRKMSPIEWAKEDKIDYHLFLYWANQQMTKAKYDEIKRQVYKEKIY